MKDRTLSGRLLFAQNLLENATNHEDVSDAMALYGFDEARIDEGKGMYDSAQELHEQQKIEKGQSSAAFAQLSASKAEANQLYIRHLTLARLAFKKDAAAITGLGLSGTRKWSYSGWIKEAQLFYRNLMANPAWLSEMGRYNIDQPKLQEGLDGINTVESNYAVARREEGEAQQALVNRDQVFDKLNEWIAEYVTVARIALVDQPQLLEVLDLVEPS